MQSAERLFIRKLCRFVLPLLAILVLVALVLFRTGEVVPTKIVARLGAFSYPFLYLTEFSDHSYRFKLEGARLRHPEILVLGNSRMNQWRSAMFKPFSFYNAGNCLYTQADYRRFLEDLGSFAPKVILFSLDFFTFNPAYDENFHHVAYDELGSNSSEFRSILKRLFSVAVKSPKSFVPDQREPLYQLPALGLHAAKTGTGFRIDGSYQYGAIMRNSKDAGAVSVSAAVSRVSTGVIPFQPASHLDPVRRAELEKFAAAALQRGIKLVAISMPYDPQVINAVESSSAHGIWKQFYGPETATWLRNQGIAYFDFTRLESFGGRGNEFFDPFHPTETAVLRMLLRILGDPHGAAIFKGLHLTDLEQALSQATHHEVYKNQF